MTNDQVLTADQIAELQRIDSPTIANAVDRFGVRDPTEGFASLDLRCMFPELPPVVGYAVTCTDDSSTPLSGTGTGYRALYEAIAAAPKPAFVVFKSAVDSKRSLHMGEVMASIMAGLGAVAVVTDGGVRDLAGVQSSVPGFQMFAAGMVVAGGAPSLIDVGVTVGIFGLTISPGDLLHGDANGLLTVPRSVAGEVAAVARQIQQEERVRIEEAQQPGFSVASLGPGH
jgi:regulator of RNase E activity RraA